MLRIVSASKWCSSLSIGTRGIPKKLTSSASLAPYSSTPPGLLEMFNFQKTSNSRLLAVINVLEGY